MGKRRENLLVIFGVLALGTAVQADMMPAARLNPGNAQPPSIECRAVLSGTCPSTPCTGWSATVGLDSLPVEPSLQASAEARQTGETQPVQVLQDDQSSLSLCLYALMGFGLCRSAPWVRKLHFGSIPHWYHDGGPYQVGHSHAISPDCLCDAPACCFIQPDCGADDHIPQDRFATVISQWRRSQFTPAVLAPRGPPFGSC